MELTMKNTFIKTVGALAFPLLMTGCSDFFFPNTDDVLFDKDYVGSSDELYSGYMGIASQVQAIADQAIFLEGLRGDFLEPTENASQMFWDIYNYSDRNQAFERNMLADPKGYYNVVVHCNDYLKRVFEYMHKNPTVIPKENYRGLIGGALRYKAWAYLMMGKIYGEAVYFDDALSIEDDLSVYPTLKLDALVEKCIDLIEVGIDGYDGKANLKWGGVLYPGVSSENITMKEWNRITPPYQALLGELYLWRAAREQSHGIDPSASFQAVLGYCIHIIEEGGMEQSWTLNKSAWGSKWRNATNTFARHEHISVMFYDYTLKQTNRLVDYYSNITPNKYLLRPTDASVKRFESQTPHYGKVEPTRGEGSTYRNVNGQRVAWRWIASHQTSDKVYRNDPIVVLYRAGQVHLFMVEALAGLGRFQEALVFLNGGIAQHYDGRTGQFVNEIRTPEQDASYAYPAGHYTEFPKWLYRTSTTSEEECQGVRGRAEVGPVAQEMLLEGRHALVASDKMRLDSLLVEETHLELAGEACAYYTMIRMSKRWGAAHRNVWANKVADKYPGGNSALESRLASDIEEWFINYNLKLPTN